MANRIQFRRGTAAQAAIDNPLLGDGEPGYTSDTLEIKIGNGATLWNDLPAFTQNGTSEIVTSTPATIAAGRFNHTVIVDTNTIGSVAEISLTDGTTLGHKITVLSDGTYGTTVLGTGLTAQSVDAGASRVYIWGITGWAIQANDNTPTTVYDSAPVGSMSFATMDAIPNGWLRLDGSLVPILDYPDLYAIYGTDHGGDGVTTFGLPDARGLGLEMVGTQLLNGRLKGDAALGVMDKREDAVQFHYHSLTNYDRVLRDGTNSWGDQNSTNEFMYIYNLAVTAMTEDTVNGAGEAARGDTHTHGPAVMVHFMVKARHTIVGEYQDPNIDQRLTDVENQLLYEQVYDTGWLDLSGGKTSVSLLLSHNMSLDFDELKIFQYWRSPLTGKIMRMGEGNAYSTGGGHSFFSVNNQQIKMQIGNVSDRAGLYWADDVSGNPRWNDLTTDGAGDSFSEVKIIIMPVNQVAVKGDDGPTGPEGPIGLTGPQGASIVASPYVPATTYSEDEFCVYETKIYISTTDNNVGNQPDTSFPSWTEWNWGETFVGMESFISVDATPPTGWLKQDGTSYLKTTYPELWAFLGSAYEVDTLNFHVPDKSGLNIVGIGTQTVDGEVVGDAVLNAGDKRKSSVGDHGHRLPSAYSNNSLTPYPTISPTEDSFAMFSHGDGSSTAYQHVSSEPVTEDGTQYLDDGYSHGPEMAVQFIIKARTAAPTASTDIGVDARLSAVEAKDIVQDGRLDVLETSNLGRRKITKILSNQGYSYVFVEDSNKDMIAWGGTNSAVHCVMGTGQDAGSQATKVPEPPGETGDIVDQGQFGVNAYRLYDSGNLYLWGYNATGQCGTGDIVDQTLPYLSLTNVAEVFVPLQMNYVHSTARVIAKKNDGTVWGVGHQDAGSFGLGVSTNYFATWQELTWITPGTLRKAWVFGAWHEFIIWAKTDGTIWFTGTNAIGQAGNGSISTEINIAIDISSFWGGGELTAVGEIVDICATNFHYSTAGTNTGFICMLRADGSVRTCGDNQWGSIGDGTVVDKSTPYTVPLGEAIVQIGDPTGSPSSIFARSASGKVWRWGYNQQAQLGDGSTTDRSTPYNSGDTDDIDNNCDLIMNTRRGSHNYNWVSTASFLRDSRDGMTWACGDNGNGVCGIGNATANISTFTRVHCRETFIDIRVNGYADSGGFATGVTEDGRVLVWGYGGRYNLGLHVSNPTGSRWVPVELIMP